MTNVRRFSLLFTPRSSIDVDMWLVCKELEATRRDTVCGASARGLLDW